MTSREMSLGPMLLTIAFFVAKVTGYIDWSLWWVFSPLWLPIVAVVGFLLFCLVMAVASGQVKVPTKGKRRK